MAIADLSDLITRLTGGNDGSPETVFFHKLGRVAGAVAVNNIAGRPASLWRYEGFPAAGAIPTSGEIPDRSTVGAIPFTPPGADREKLLISAGIAPSVSGVFLLYDRLFHIGGLSGIETADQSIQGSPASPALTRNTGGAGNMAWYEIYGLLGTAARVIEMTYTNSEGTSGRTSSVNIGGTGFREIGRAQRMPLQDGDVGIRAIEKVTLNGSTATQGEFGMTIANPLAWIPVGSAGVGGWRDYTTGLPGIPAIHPDACLSLLFIASTTAPPELHGAMTFVEK